MAEVRLNRGVVLLCQGDRAGAIASFEQAAQVSLAGKWSWIYWAAAYGLGRAHLLQGERSLALDCFQRALALFEPYPWKEWRFHWWPFLSTILSGIEAALDDVQAFRTLCRNLPLPKQQQIAASVRDQWWLEPVELTPLAGPDFEDRFTRSLAAGWSWLDPFQDCAFEVEHSLVIRAANGRDLWYLNRSAPRLMRPAGGDFVIQTRLISPDETENEPAMGGLLLWQDEQNFLRLAWGNRGPGELSFEGSLNNQDMLVGRGRWPEETKVKKRGSEPQPITSSQPSPSTADQETLAVWLRLERRGDQVRALASSEGERWFSVGQTTFPAQAVVEVGLHATGWIDRLLYPGAYRAGTTTSFEMCQVWNLSRDRTGQKRSTNRPGQSFCSKPLRG